ncbi:hypothetical protein [Pseudomonas orientalis]|uniref:Uncharacterized protein n=1 Tax=Pseudomonas orientalis TaxID=76758 RepID=A0A2L0RUG4_9PSED|nr:hypothetical protein [Pseudomonas orientalis]AUZ45364.1 hypothetical protein BOP93_07055 [Pseudomonas orientalis]
MLEDIDNAMEGIESEKSLIKRFDKVSTKIFESENNYSKEELLGIFKLKNLLISFRSNGEEIAFIQSARVTTVIPTSEFKHGAFIAKAFEVPATKEDENEFPILGFLVVIAFFMVMFNFTVLKIKKEQDTAQRQFCIIENPTLEFVGKSDIDMSIIKGKLNCKSGMTESETQAFEAQHAMDELNSVITSKPQVNSGIEYLPKETKFYADRKVMNEQFDKEVARRKALDPKFDEKTYSNDGSKPTEVKINTQPPAPGYVSIIAFAQENITIKND